MFLKRLLIVLLLLTLAAAAGYAWRWQQAQDTAREWANQMRPFGILRVGKVWPSWNPRRIVMRNASFEPVGAWQKLLGAPIGYRVQADQLVLTAPDESHPESNLQIRALGVTAPLLPGPEMPLLILEWLGHKPPSAADLQVAALSFDAVWEGRYREADTALKFNLQIHAPGLLRLHWQAEMNLPRDDWQQARFDRAGINAQTLEVADLGYFTQSKEILAARSLMDVQGYEKALIARLQEMAESGKWSWSNASYRAAQQFIEKPEYLNLSMRPLSTVALPNLGLYAPGDLFALFNLTLNTSGTFGPVPPGEMRD